MSIIDGATKRARMVYDDAMRRASADGTMLSASALASIQKAAAMQAHAEFHSTIASDSMAFQVRASVCCTLCLYASDTDAFSVWSDVAGRPTARILMSLCP